MLVRRFYALGDNAPQARRHHESAVGDEESVLMEAIYRAFEVYKSQVPTGKPSVKRQNGEAFVADRTDRIVRN